ncbi:MAG: cytochrome c [Gemmatimonadetes bacterium]|nr:cytochrome c [Gemmatimonadota bacterium]
MTRNATWSPSLAVMIGLLPLTGVVGQPAVEEARPTVLQSQELPAGVTAQMITEGRQIFTGPGLCSTCHGENGEGTPLAPSLGDATWLNIDGSYDAIVKLVNTGVPQPKEAMIPMVPKGGSTITDEQVRAVAAYVWSLSKGK